MSSTAQVPAKSSFSQELVLKIMMWVDVVIALIVIGFGVYKYTLGHIDTFSQVFVPFYLILFGSLLVCAELEWLFFVKYCKFLDNGFGRGIYNVFLATMVMNAINSTFSSQDRNETMYIFTIVISSLLVTIGALQILFYILNCGGKSQKFQNYDQQLQLEQQMKSQQGIQQPLINKNGQLQGNLIDIQKLQTQDPAAYLKWLQTQTQEVQQKNPQLVQQP